MKVMKRVSGLALTTAIISGLLVPQDAGAETLGWSEEKGYTYSNESVVQEIVLYGVPDKPASRPQSHTAKIIYRDEYAAYIKAQTKWENKYHYTRARWESGSAIKGDSGRVWGSNQSTAISGYHNRDLSTYKARSYWGS